jgi:hypothetical protein
MELLLVVRRGTGAPGARARGGGAARTALREIRLARLFALSYHPARIRRSFAVEGDTLLLGDEPALQVPMRHFWRFLPDSPIPPFASAEAAEAFIFTLSGCAVRDIREEIDVLSEIASGLAEGREKERTMREILRLLNKLAHRKYSEVFAGALAVLRSAVETRLGAGPSFSAGLDVIEDKARRRIAASRPRDK